MDKNTELIEYYAVNDRPVKVITTSQGGGDVMVMNMRTGEFERDLSYGYRIREPGKDVDKFTEQEFDDYVLVLKQYIASQKS